MEVGDYATLVWLMRLKFVHPCDRVYVLGKMKPLFFFSRQNDSCIHVSGP
jgi:hypothetical protein